MRLGQGWALLVAVARWGGGVAVAQDSVQTVQLADRGPRFLSAPTGNTPSVDMSDASVFKRRVSLELVHVPLTDALRAVGRQARVAFAFREADVPVDKPVSVSATNITLRGALDELLVDTDLDVQLSANGLIAIVPRRGTGQRIERLQQPTGHIAGRVTDVVTQVPLDQVSVSIEGVGAGAVTRGDGRYAIRGVVPGLYRLIARRVGYAPLTKPVTVETDSVAAVDFALTATASKLDEVVTTAAGPQRRVELGNAIATINADSVARTAPVTNLTDVISGRAPGVEVLQTNGLAGSGPAIRIRGRGSVTLSNDPIYIVDGVRMDGSPGGQVDAFGGNGGAFTVNPTASRLNDLDPSEVESIEVLRGPSAATEYGTDAANGVVVITTKHGRSGAPRWAATAEEGLSTMPVHFPDNYYSWGHTTDGTHTATPCPLIASPPTVFGTVGSITGTCAVDSVTRWQPLNHYETSLFGTGNRGHYELQVSGGGVQTQYFFGGGLTTELGAVQMPQTEAARLERERGEAVPRDQLRPNALTDANVRGRMNAALGSIADVSISAAYLSATQRSPGASVLLFSALSSSGIRDTLSGYSAYGGIFAPGATLAITGSEGVNRFTGGLSSTWRPATWLSTRSTVGLDDAGKTDELIVLPGQGRGVCNNPSCSQYGPIGYRSVGLARTDFYTVDLGATATAALTRVVSTKTTAGLQYYDRRTHGSTVAVSDLALGNPTLNGGSIYNQLEQGEETATLGSYIEETVGFAERLFLVGAVRVDAGSGFGTAYKAATYPKASASWVVLPEGGRSTALRLRAAYGQSGVQPPAGSALQLEAPVQTYYATGTVPGAILLAVGNPGLKPERTAEFEGGFDLSLFRQRVTAEVTGYSKLSHDALVSVPLEGSVNGGGAGSVTVGGTELINLGSVRNRGLEASITARVLDARLLQWDITVSGSDNENRLVTLGPGVSPIDQTSLSEGPYKQAPGYPLYGTWAYRIHYRDLNHDGILTSNEVTQDTAASFIGPSLAPRQFAVNTGVTLFGGRLRVGGQVDHRGGQYLTNSAAWYSNIDRSSRGTNDPMASLPSQARAVATLNDPFFHPNSGYVEPAAFTRLRELSLTYLAPGRLATALRARTLSVTVAGRNLALWTKYTGSDPEVSAIQGENRATSAGGVPTTALNPDVVGDFFSVPQMRSWTLKVNVGL